MTRLLYLEDPCLSSFRAKINHIEGDWIELDQTAFYPGGGGQEADGGCIEGQEVIEVRKREGIEHLVPGHSLKEGQEIGARIDWERRLELMRGHTAEHMLFSTLSRLVDDLELVKISIGQEKKSFILKGGVNWDVISRAQREVNDAVAVRLEVSSRWVDRSDPVLEDVRAKLERIHGDEVRVVSIEGFDAAACSGVHVPNTGDIVRIIVTKLTAAKPKGAVEVEFEVGRRAVDKAFDLANIALRSSDLVGSHPDDLTKALENMREEIERSRRSLRQYGREVLGSLQPEEISGVSVYKGVYYGLDKKTVMAAANRFVRGKRTICVLVVVEESLIVVMARSADLEIDCREILNQALMAIGGRSGGAPEFATGGAQSVEDAKQALESALEILRQTLSEN